jgi:hypothetical protein
LPADVELEVTRARVQRSPWWIGSWLLIVAVLVLLASVFVPNVLAKYYFTTRP